MSTFRSIKINIVVGGRFHAGQLYGALTELGHNARIYASSPARYFQDVPREAITFVPKPVQLLQKGLAMRMPREMSEYSSIAFDAIVSRIMRPADLVWGFNGDSYLSGRRIKASGGRYVVDRACPHFVEQQELLRQESSETGYPFVPQTRGTRTRFLKEYDIADLIVVPSEYSASSFPRQGVDAARVAIAPLDANARFQEGASKVSFAGTGPGDILVGLVGGSFLRKGILYLLRAVDALARRDIRLIFRATERNVMQHQEARALCKKLAVVFVPYINDINSFYRSLDMLVLPSIDEGFGMVVYEALGNGVPVIASSHVGAIDGMVPGRDFIMVPPQSSEKLAAAIVQLADDPVLRARIGSYGRSFHAERVASGGQYRRAIDGIIKKLAKPGR